MSSRKSTSAWKRFLVHLIQEQLRKDGLLPAPGGEWPSTKDLIRSIVQKYSEPRGTRGRLIVLEGDQSMWSGVLTRRISSNPRPSEERLQVLFLIVSRRHPRAAEPTAEDVEKALQPERERFLAETPEPPVAGATQLRFSIPPSIDALVLEYQLTLRPPTVEHGRPTVEAQVVTVRSRYRELKAGGDRLNRRSPSRFFYLSWRKALDLQKDIQKAGKNNDPILVLDGWAMATGPTFCLLRRGEKWPNHTTTLDQVGRELDGTAREQVVERHLSEQLKTSTIIATQDTTSATAFGALLDRLEHGGQFERRPRVHRVSFMTSLVELLEQGVLPEDWILIGGPSQYWEIPDMNYELVHASEPAAARIEADNHESHYVIATRGSFLSSSDPAGLKAAEYFRKASEQLKVQFNDPNQKACTAFRQQLAETILGRYPLVADKPTKMSVDSIKEFVKVGMNLLLGSPSGRGFVPIADYRVPEPAKRKSIAPEKGELDSGLEA